ncbi:hypothetical protein [Nostoc sp.]
MYDIFDIKTPLFEKKFLTRLLAVREEEGKRERSVEGKRGRG